MILGQPFPSNQHSLKVVKLTLYAGFIVFLILVLFQPFGFNKTPSSLIFRNALFFGLATFLVATANAFLLPFLFPVFFNEQRWTVSKELLMMLWQVISVSFANLLLMNWLYGEQISWQTVIETLGITAAVGIFPITLIILLKQQALLRKYGAEAAMLDQQLKSQLAEKTAGTSPLLTLSGDNQDETLSLRLNDLRFISSADNYIKLHYIQDGNLTSSVLRSTLKKTNERLQPHQQLFRCHRTYIVNLQAVDRVSGNAQGFKLHLRDVEEPVPVSRNLNKALTARLEKQRWLFH